MARLDDALQSPDVRKGNPTVGRSRVQRSFKTLVSIAAVLALATIGVWLAVRPQTMPSSPADNAARTIASDALPTGDTAAPSNSASDPGVALTQLSEQHFDRSKLVVLSLANKDPQDSGDIDWDYERQLAASLLGDTRVYRQAAEERGMSNLADVMRDLELVLLQTSMSESPDAESLAQLQRLIRRRDLITKMDVVKTSGLLP
jgi:hypothetical protein